MKQNTRATLLLCLFVLLAFVIPGYWCFTYTGLFLIFAELQLASLGEYYPFLTGLLCFVVMFVPTLVLSLKLPPSWFSFSSPNETYDGWLVYLLPWAIQNKLYRYGVLFTLAGLGLGSCFLLFGLSAGSLSTPALSSLEQGEAPPSHYVELEGELLVQPTLRVEAKVYIPVVSSSWRAGQPVSVFLETYQSWVERYKDDLMTGRYRGTLSLNGLPGVAREELRRQGLLPGSYWVLHYREDPQELIEAGLIFLGVGLVFLLVMGRDFRMYYRKRREPARRD